MTAFELPFMRTALAAGLLAGNALALLGIFVLARGVSFSGLAVSQLAALGAVLGAVLGLHYGGFGAALACVAAGLLALDRLQRRTRLPADAWVAGFYLLAAAASVLILAKAPHGEAHTLSVFFGNVLALGAAEVVESAVLLAAAAGVVAVWRWRLVWISFDPFAAAAAGVPARGWTLAFLSLFAAAMTLGIHLFGVLLALAFLLLPGAFGLLWAGRLRHLFTLVPIVTSVAVLTGLALSFHLDFPTGPFIAAELAALLIAGGLVRSLRP